MVSIITVVNKIEVFNQGLKRSILKQTFKDYEVIVVYNDNGQFASMVEALEEGINKAVGEWYLFMHPDIDFMSEDTLENFYAEVISAKEKDNSIVIFGVAGQTHGEKSKIVSQILHGKDKRLVSNERFTKSYIEVQTVDACCFMINKQDFKKLGFCHKLTGYHMYTEELCIHASMSQRKVVVIPAKLWHFSDGISLDYSYYKATKQVIRLYPELNFFNTTCFQWKVSKLLQVRLSFYILRNIIHHKLIV